MDYCLQCRRHLNGALACAGCGTPVEELRYHSPLVPETGAAPSGPPPAEVFELDPVERPSAGHRRPASRADARRARGPVRARRARRRRGRKVLIGTVGLLMAAGALSLAELALEHPGEGGPATAVRQEDVVETEPLPEPSGDTDLPEGPSPVNEPAAATSSAARPTATGTVRAGGTAEGTGDPGTAPGAGDGIPGGDGPPAPGEASGPAASEPAPGPSSSRPPAGNPSSTPPGNPPPPNQPPPSQSAGDPPPNPQPSPTQTCSWFLWWCV